ncbi:MAG: polyprenyl synthetase family protein [Candidatus Brocadiia bacterium]
MGDASDGSESLARRLLAVGSRIEPVLEEMFPPEADAYLSEAVRYHLGTGGKRVRPAICLLTCEHLGGEAERALHFAAAVEVLHNMLLIHDDLEDGDRVRRDQPTVWVRYGAGNAVNVGDYMLGIAYQAVLRSPVTERQRLALVRSFTDAYTDTCRGQAYDLNTRGQEELTVRDYLRMVTLKTGRYMALGMVGGAIVAGADEEVVDGLNRLGQKMGAAFQIRDDLIDLTVGKGRGGTVGNDIREGKSSILYAHSITAADSQQARELSSIMRKPREHTTDADVARARAIYEGFGSLEYARTAADRLVSEAFDIIPQIPVREPDFFRRVTEFMVSRKT